MVGKLSDDKLMSGSRIPVLYLWQFENGHHYSTPNDELRKSIAAKNGEFEHFDIGEPGIVGNLLEPVLMESAFAALGFTNYQLTPPVMRYNGIMEVSCDGVAYLDKPVTLFASDLVELPDGLESLEVSGPIPVECKCTSAFKTDDIPLYRGPIQLQMQMIPLDAEFGIIVTLYQSIRRHIKVYRRDQEIQGRIIELCEDFKNRVESENFYPPVNPDDCAKTFPGGNPDVYIDTLEDDIARLERLKVDAKAFASEIEALEVKVMNAMGDSEIAQAGRFQVKWPVRNYKAQPEKVVPAKEARQVRLKSLQIKEIM